MLFCFKFVFAITIGFHLMYWITRVSVYSFLCAFFIQSSMLYSPFRDMFEKMLMTLRILYFVVFRWFFFILFLVIVSHDAKQFSMYRIILCVEMFFVFGLLLTHTHTYIQIFFSFSFANDSNRFKIAKIKESLHRKCVRTLVCEGYRDYAKIYKKKEIDSNLTMCFIIWLEFHFYSSKMFPVKRVYRSLRFRCINFFFSTFLIQFWLITIILSNGCEWVNLFIFGDAHLFNKSQRKSIASIALVAWLSAVINLHVHVKCDCVRLMINIGQQINISYSKIYPFANKW